MTKSVIFGVSVLLPISCCVVIHLFMGNVGMIVAGKVERPAKLARLVVSGHSLYRIGSDFFFAMTRSIKHHIYDLVVVL